MCYGPDLQNTTGWSVTDLLQFFSGALPYVRQFAEDPAVLDSVDTSINVELYRRRLRTVVPTTIGELEISVDIELKYYDQVDAEVGTARPEEAVLVVHLYYQGVGEDHFVREVSDELRRRLDRLRGTHFVAGCSNSGGSKAWIAAVVVPVAVGSAFVLLVASVTVYCLMRKKLPQNTGPQNLDMGDNEL